MTVRIGQQFGNYQIERLIGQGGFADVYLGKHVRLQTLVAIKVLRTQLHETDAAAFVTEAQTIARLEHPHIVRVLDFDIEEGAPFLVMNYASGGTLRARHGKGTCVPISLVVSYVNEVAEALQYAHDEKVIHRDVKPENMLLGKQGEVVLSDFGIATLAHNSYSIQTQNIAGTIPYMAPEQIQAHPRPASDQYALAIVVYEWLCGIRPFDGTYYELLSKHITASPAPLLNFNPALSPEVEQVVLTALAKDPKSRFENVHTFASTLEQASKNKNSFFIGAEPGLPPFYVPDTGVINSNKTTSDSGIKLSVLKKQPAETLQNEHKNQMPHKILPDTSHPQRKYSRRERRNVLALIATGAIIAAGSATMITLNLSHPTASKVQKELTPTIPQNPSPKPQKNTIGSTTLLVNSAQVFSNPADEQHSLLIHLPNGNFVAYENTCTHEGVEVSYDPSTHFLICPAHGAIFDPNNNANVLGGPAPTPLKKVEIRVNTDGTIVTL